jgi:hypothetical protein
VDVKGLARSPALSQAVDLESLGLPGTLRPLLTYALDLLVLAVPEWVPDARNGALVIFEGEVDLRSLVALASGLGMEIDPDPQIYQEHPLWSGQLFGSTALSLADLGNNIGVLAQGPVTDHSVPERTVKEVLDGADGAPGVPLGGPVFWGLAGRLPSGPVTVLADECRGLATLPLAIVLDGCVASAITIIEVGEEQVAAHLVLEFGTEAQAEAALPRLREGLANGEIEVRETAVRQEGALLRIRMAGDTQEILAVLRGEN